MKSGGKMITIKQFEEMPVCVIPPAYLKGFLEKQCYFIPWPMYLMKFMKRAKNGEVGMLHGIRYFLNKSAPRK
jgi:hypothetical protein